MTIGDLGKDYVTVEPTEVYAGSTWRWKIDFSEYSSKNILSVIFFFNIFLSTLD